MSLKWFVIHAYSGYENQVKKTLLERIEMQGMGDKFGKIFPILLLRIEIHPEISALLTKIDNIVHKEDIIKVVEKVAKIPFFVHISNYL